MIVFDPSAFAKKGAKSVGVARQWCGRLGKVENCQVGVYMGYVSRIEHALVNIRLYLPEEWTKDRARRKEAGVPKEVGFRTRHELALEMLAESGRTVAARLGRGGRRDGPAVGFPPGIAGARRALPAGGALEHTDPRPGGAAAGVLGAGAPSQESVHAGGPLVRARAGGGLGEDRGPRWRERTVGDRGGEAPRAGADTETGGTGPDELLFVTRELQADNTYKLDYYLSNADPETPLAELARVAKAEHRIEECFERAKGEAGLADYQVRNWTAWHHHQTLSLLAAWFLTQETRRGKNPDPRADIAAAQAAHRGAHRQSPQGERPFNALSPKYPLARTQRASPVISSSFT